MSQQAVLEHIGHHHPETILDNPFFDALGIDSEAQWIKDATGIEQRRSVLSREQVIQARQRGGQTDWHNTPFISIADFAAKAWSHLETRQQRELDLDLLLCGTSIPDYDIPANGCVIAARLGYECTAFDINSACSSFVVNLHMARNLINNGSAKHVGIVIPERYTTRVDYTDRNSCVLWGDGSAAATVRANATQGFAILDTFVESNPANFSQVKIEVGGNFWQNGRAVQKFAISKTVAASKKMLQRHDLSPGDIQYFIGHQANLRMLQSCASHLELTPEQHLHNVSQFGNQGAAGPPSILSTHWDRFQPGDRVLLSVVGAGLTWGSALLQKL